MASRRIGAKLAVSVLLAPLLVLLAAAAVNEAPEFPSSETGVRSVPENTGAGTDIGAPVAAEDPGNDSLAIP